MMAASRKNTSVSRPGIFWQAGAFVALFLLVVFWPAEAAAAQATLGQIICNIKDNLAAYPKILNFAAYTIGLFLVVRGVLLLKKHGENPSQPQIVPAVAQLTGGALLLSLRPLTRILQKTIFSSKDAAGGFGCKPGDPVGSVVGLDQMMTNFVKNVYEPIFVLLSMIAIAVGLTFIVSGLLKGAKTGTNPQAADPKSIVVHLIFGAILISIGTVLPDVLKSIFGSGDVSKMSAVSLISWSKIVGSGVDTTKADAAVKAVLAFIQIIGGISFLRGWLILKKAIEGGGQATVPQGFTHIIGGAMAINIDVMIRAIDKTFGFGIVT